jgi:hypothetical protein
MSNYSINQKIKVSGDFLEIENKDIIPISDIFLIKESIDSKNSSSDKNIFTYDKLQFENIKSIFENYINRDEYISIISKIYEEVKRGIENKKIFKNNFSTLIDFDMEYFINIFLGTYIELYDGNEDNKYIKVKNGIYYYKKIDDTKISCLTEYFNEEISNIFIKNLYVYNLMTNSTNGNIALLSFNKTIDDVIDNSSVLNIKRTYVMKDKTGYYKIGRSIDPICRQYQLKTGNITIELCFYIDGDRELELHHIFENKKVEREWYNLNSKDLKFIKNYNKIRKEHPEYVKYYNIN